MRDSFTRRRIAFNKKAALPFVILLFLFSGFTAVAQPAFTGGASQSLSACYDEGSISINPFLTVSDPTSGLTETWSVFNSPTNGTLAGFPTTAASTGSAVTPAGLAYMPNPGYTGSDSFTIQVSNGTSTAMTTIYVTVYALPTLSSTLSPGAICNQTTFSYTPTSTTAGATFEWSRPLVGGISNAPATGTEGISETLDNITYYTVPVTYQYTTAAHGCSSTQTVTVNVYPTPGLTSAATDTTCTGGTFTYMPTSYVAGTTYTWSRAAVPGISPATSSGTGDISESLTNSNAAPVNVVYVFMLTANGCSATRNLTVTVLPTAPITSITTASPSTVCSGTMYQNFGASIPPPAGASYVWSATNAVVVAVGGTGQFALVSFPASGNAMVSLSVINAAAGCGSAGSYAVDVSTNVSEPGSVIYYNYQLIDLDNTQDTYQWGYDNAATLDSAIIPGAVFQSYPFPGTSPDFTSNYYWVMTTKGGCEQKTYYNAPPSTSMVPNVAASVGNGLKVYPNPAENILNVALGIPGGNTEITIQNMLGQTIQATACNTQQAQLDVAALPAGCYMVNCVQNGTRIGTARFIKN